ncbi:hypothetical protein TRIUR3_00663 [Triticum urartu]|uniref:Uncharacterized protein n=1 Tax=Triticum urartu TaxID=4572 RepID=M8AZB5_TRIUA|nr:hypothetical protein TRIUR3_00663 [Triticum urartu]
MAAPRALALCVLLAVAVTNAEAASVVVGLAKCADCTRKNIKAEEAFKGLQVAIKCKNVHGDYESKAGIQAMCSAHIAVGLPPDSPEPEEDEEQQSEENEEEQLPEPMEVTDPEEDEAEQPAPGFNMKEA